MDYGRSTTFSVSLEGITETEAAGIQRFCTTNRYCAHAPGEPRSTGRCTACLPRTTRSKTNDPQCPYPTPRPFYESAVADKVLRKDSSRTNEVAEHNAKLAALSGVLSLRLGLGCGLRRGRGSAGKLGNSPQHLATMTNRNTNVLEVLVGEIMQDTLVHRCCCRQIAGRTRACRVFRANPKFVASRPPRSVVA